LVAHLKQRHAQVTDHCRALERLNAEVDTDTYRGQRLTFDYGMAIANAELVWLEGMLERLSAGPLLEDRPICDPAASDG
jgi:hypothetical protein